MHRRLSPSLFLLSPARRSSALVAVVCCACSGVAHAATPATRPTPVPAATGTLLPDAGAEAERPIAINIDGHLVDSPTPPALIDGSVYVPLRGVLESLGFMVDYLPAEHRILIAQGETRVYLNMGSPNAVVGTDVVAVTPPRMVDGHTFVPLRSLAELFKYRVNWIADSRTVAIYTQDGTKVIPVDHRKALQVGGAFGVGIDFTDATADEVPALLDAAKQAGAGMIKVRFDWATLEPQRGVDFQWPIYDVIVKGARERGLVVVGVLGNCTQWASVSNSQNTEEWRSSPPRESDYPAWSNYVKRTVGRYKNDVQVWQVWENPAASNFRSVARNYRKLARLAVEAAKGSDPNAIIHAAEPGGVELDFINDLTRNGLTPLLDGISVYPVSQWQPGALNPTESFLLPYATLQEQLQLTDKQRDYWVGGLTYPTVEVGSNANAALTSTDKATVTPASADSRDTAPPVYPARPGLLQAFSPDAQAAYLVRSMTLALAAGSPKVFWSSLRDAKAPAFIQPINTDAGTGLIHADNSPRLSFTAYQTLTKQLAGLPYAGNLALGSDVVALLFDNEKTGTLVVWSPNGTGKMVLNSSGSGATVPGVVNVATRPDSEVLDVSGKSIAGADGTLRLTNAPFYITRVASETAKACAARHDGKPLKFTPAGPSYANATSVKAVFGKTGGEDGLYWRRYADFGGVARRLVDFGDRVALATEAQRDVMDLQSSRPFIYLDVADNFMYFAKGSPVSVSVEVYRRPEDPGSQNPTGEGLISDAAGFRLEYDSPQGFKTTKWQEVEYGKGWATYTFQLPDATFSNAQGYDLLINAGGSKTDLLFGSVTVQKTVPGAAAHQVSLETKTDG